MNLKPKTSDNIVMDYEHYIGCNFGNYCYTCSINSTSTFSGDYLRELVIFKV